MAADKQWTVCQKQTRRPVLALSHRHQVDEWADPSLNVERAVDSGAASYQWSRRKGWRRSSAAQEIFHGLKLPDAAKA